MAIQYFSMYNEKKVYSGILTYLHSRLSIYRIIKLIYIHTLTFLRSRFNSNLVCLWYSSQGGKIYTLTISILQCCLQAYRSSSFTLASQATFTPRLLRYFVHQGIFFVFSIIKFTRINTIDASVAEGEFSAMQKSTTSEFKSNKEISVLFQIMNHFLFRNKMSRLINQSHQLINRVRPLGKNVARVLRPSKVNHPVQSVYFCKHCFVDH